MTESEINIKAYQSQAEKCWPKGLKDGERSIWITPAFDARDPNPSKNFGIGGCEIHFAIRRGSLIAHFYAITDLYPLSVQSQRQERFSNYPLGWGIIRHSEKQISEYDTPQDCNLLNGKCHSTVESALEGERIGHKILERGSDGVWEELLAALDRWEGEES